MTRKISISNWAFILGLAPIVVVTICTLWSMSTGLVPRCMPFIDGCLSISAACRNEPVVYFFRASMLPLTLLSVVFWWHWFPYNETPESGHASKNSDRMQFKPLPIPVKHSRQTVVRYCGTVGSLFFALYVSFLGTDGPFYEFLRRTGVYVFFGGTAIAQLTTTLTYWRVFNNRYPNQQAGKTITLITLMSVTVILMLLLGPTNLLLKSTLADPDAWENRIEWIFGTLLFGWYLLWSGLKFPTQRREFHNV